MDKKKRQPPKHLITLHHFEFTFEDVSPDNYVYYLEERLKKKLTLITMDSNIKKDRQITAHTSFRLNGINGWIRGIIYSDGRNTVVKGDLSVKRGDIIFGIGASPFIGLLVILSDENRSFPPSLLEIITFGLFMIPIYLILIYIKAKGVQRQAMWELDGNLREVLDEHRAQKLEKQKNKPKRG